MMSRLVERSNILTERFYGKSFFRLTEGPQGQFESMNLILTNL